MERIICELRQVNPVMLVQFVMSGSYGAEWVPTLRNIIRWEFQTQIKHLIEPSLTLADIYIFFFAKCAAFLLFLVHRHISILHSQLVFMFSSSHKTRILSLHTLDPLMHLMGAASGLTRFSSFFIFFSSLFLLLTAKQPQLCRKLWKRS